MNHRKTLLALAAAGALALPATAQADTTRQFGNGFNCSATARTPHYWSQGGFQSMRFGAGDSCGGSQYWYQQRLSMCLQILGANVTWFNVSGACVDTGWAAGGSYLDLGRGFTPGHAYRVDVSSAEVQHNGSGVAMGPIDSQVYVP